MTDTMNDVALAPFGPEHLDGAVALSRQVSWPHRHEDWALLLAVSRGIVVLNGDRVVGTAFCTPFGEDLAAINMIIVEESRRGSGLGRCLMNEVMALGGKRTLRLVATEAGRPLYEKLGFVATGEVVQHQGCRPTAAGFDQAVDWAGPDDESAIAELDRRAFGADRGALVARMLAEGRAAVLRRQGRVVAFALCRSFGRGRVVGPVVAETPEEAKHLIAAQMAAHHGSFLRVDTAAETGLGPWLAEEGLPQAGGGTVMYRGTPPRAMPDAPRSFALSSQALG